MDSTFGILDVIAFLVFAILIAVAVVMIVFLGQLPGRLARQRGHPQASAIDVASWIGLATLGLLWPLALIWALIRSSSTSSFAPSSDRQKSGVDEGGQPKTPTPIKRAVS